MKPILNMLVGIPASGKSYFANNLVKNHNYILHSSDDLRKELYGDASVQGDHSALFSELHRRIKEDLKSGKNVVYDATNINYKKRMAFLREIKNIECNKICTVIATPISECIKRNSKRDRTVPIEVIYRMRENFDFPAYFEGWDNIEIVYNCIDSELENYTFDRYYEDYKDYDQKNEHHNSTLYYHCFKVYKYLLDNSNNSNLIIAGYLHDCGKPYVASNKDRKGNITENTHYYNHHKVSSYESIFYAYKEKCSTEDIIKICSYVLWHMQPYFNNTEKLVNKYRKMWGEEFFNDIMLLHKADVLAH